MPSAKLTAPIAVGFIVAMSLLTGERTRCHAQPPAAASATPSERPENPLAAVYRACDTDKDGGLTEAEYLNRAGREMPVLRREFKVFDFNGDGRMSLAEFLTVPVGQPEDQRGTIPDPVVLLSEARLAELTSLWKKWDQDDDDLLAANEFRAAAIPSRIRGLESSGFDDWDLDHDGKISREEAARLLDIALGVRAPTGEPLRSKDGRVLDWRMFRALNPNKNGKVRREDYVKALGPTQKPETWFPTIHAAANETFGPAEFATSSHRTDPVPQFLGMDVDLNGRLSAKELDALPPGWGPPDHNWLPGFDDDGDGEYSLHEFLLIPHVNLLAPWHSAKDADSDGKLSPGEFRFDPGVALAALSAEYFRRLDVNDDRSLSLDEYPFVTTHRPPNEIYVQFAGGKAVTITIPNYPHIYSPEISPDGKWVAVDGWNHGQTNLAAHLLIASVDTDEVRDLGFGCIPHWSADGRRIAYSKYGQGVFIRDFQGDAEEESIDRLGWAIHFSPDGKQAAYVKRSNFVIYNLATEEQRLVFPDNQSPYNSLEHNFTWSPDSRRICFKGHRANGAIDVAIVTVTGGDPNLRVHGDAKDVASDFAWHPDGKRILSPRTPPTGQRTQIFEFDPDGNKPAERFPEQPKNRNNIGVSCTRDAKTFVFMNMK